MDVKDGYERYWKGRPRARFMDYERNWVLPKLFSRSKKVLDLACGDGFVTQYLTKELKLEVVGVDLSENAAKAGSLHGIKIVTADIEKGIPFDAQKFDTVFWGDNIEHLFNPEKVVKEIKRVLKDKGRLILSCPNIGYLRYRIYHLLKGELPDTEWSGNPIWRWNHIRFFTTKIIKDLLSKNGFRVKKVIGVNRRFPEKYFVGANPDLLAMILVIEAEKK